MNKKEIARRIRESAERDADAHIESERRQARIKVLWELGEHQFKGTKNAIKTDQKIKQQKIKTLFDTVQELTNDDLLELVELIGLQDREIDHLTRFRRDWERIEAFYPEQLKNLSTESSLAGLQPYIDKWIADRKPKSTYEQKRRRYKWSEVGEIEREFGGVENSVPKKSDQLNFGLSAYQRQLGIFPLLDGILSGGGVSMLRLQELFGVNRNRFPKNLPNFRKGRERLYDYRAVTAIMDGLLSDQQPIRKAPLRGRPACRWLSDIALRARVLREIEKRIASIPVAEPIARRFKSIVHRHMPTLD